MNQIVHTKRNHWPGLKLKTISVLDNPKMKYVNILNDLTDIHSNNEIDKVEGVIDRLNSYASEELAHEEKLLMETSYPEAAAHIASHKIFRSRILEFKHELMYRNLYIVSNMLVFLRKWLVTHVLNQDRKYAVHVQSTLTPKNHWPVPEIINQKEVEDSEVTFVNIFNDLVDNKNKSGFNIMSIIERLEMYTRDEIRKEEELLKKSNYENSEEHIENHRVLFNKLREFKQEVEYGNPYIFNHILKFLKKWIISHIMLEDRQHKEYVEQYLNLMPNSKG